MKRTILSADINDNLDVIPEMIAGIGKPSAYSLMSNKKSLTEAFGNEYSDELSKENHRIVSHAIQGENYHEDIERLHKNVRPYIQEGEHSNVEDNYIYDTLKGGKPSADKVLHVLDIMDERNNGWNTANSRYLKQKWEPFLDTHVRERPLITKVQDANYKLEELQQVPKKLSFDKFRVVMHHSRHKFEVHPTLGLRYVGRSYAEKFGEAMDERSRDTRHYLNTDAHLTEHYSKFPHDHIKEYTLDSGPLNRYLHNVVGYANHGDNPRYEPENLERMSNSISEHFQSIPHPTHTGDFHVYTGLSSMANPKTTEVTDEHGHKLLHSKGFVSTSLSMPVAESFSFSKHDVDLPERAPGDLLKIRIPGGYPHGAYVRSQSHHSHEFEYLLDKNHTFKIHPEPTYHVAEGKIIRTWNAEIHPRDSLKNREWNAINTNEKVGMALNPDAPEHILSRAATDSSQSVRAAAAKHPNLPEYHLEHLASSPIGAVRHAAMTNPKLPAHLEDMAFSHFDIAAMRGLATKPNLSEATKTRLVNVDHKSVNRALASRTDLSEEHLNKLVQTEDPETRHILAKNVSIKPHHVESLMDDWSHETLKSLAQNPALTKEQINTLEDHSNETIRHLARNNPKKWQLE